MNKLTESELYFYFYKDILDKEKTKVEVNFIKSLCDFSKDSYLLDMPCFFGRHSLLLAFELPSIHVVAVDINFKYLELARQGASEKRISNIEFIQADMRKVNFKNVFKCALCLYTSFGYFSNEENRRVLKNYHQCLSEKGMFLLDIINPNSFSEGEFIFAQKGEDKILDSVKKSDRIGFWDINRKYKIGSEIHEFDYQLRLYTKQELIALLSDVGFNKMQFYGDFDGSAYHRASKRIIVAASSGLK